RSFPGREKSRRRKAGPVPQRLLLEAPPSPLSSRPERSVVERSALSAVLPRAGEVKAMKRVLFSNYRCWKRRPPLCHLDRSAAEWRDLRCERTFPGNVFRPEKSWAKGPPKVMKNGSCSATTVAGSGALPFVISTGAQGGGETW